MKLFSRNLEILARSCDVIISKLGQTGLPFAYDMQKLAFLTQFYFSNNDSELGLRFQILWNLYWVNIFASKFL